MKILRFTLLALSFILMLSHLGRADSANIVKFDFARTCRVGSHTFVLENSTLSDVVRGLRTGKIVNTGPPGNADPLWVVDYRIGETVVRFESDGDMGGNEHCITGVSVSPASEPPNQELPVIKEGVTFIFGSIGMSFSRLQQELGPTELGKGTACYKYEAQVTTSSRKDLQSRDSFFDITAYLNICVVRGKVVAISISHITST